MRWILLSGIFVAGLAAAPAAAADLAKVVIIKADDFRGPNQAWTNFLTASRQLGVKVSIGVIADSIHGNPAMGAWMQAEEKRGDVEFWNHGWDHQQWTANGQTISEFHGSGLPHQSDHLARSQAALKAALGRNVAVLGTPYNGFDGDTASAINQTPELGLFFVHNVAAAEKLVTNRVAVLDIISESDGTARPNAAKFAAVFDKRPAGPVSLQFHPPYFDAAHLDEYQKIIVWLKGHGYRMVLPSEYLALSPTNSLP